MTAPVPELFDLVQGRPVASGPGLVQSALEHRLGGQLVSKLDSGELTLSARDQRILIAADIATTEHHRHLWHGLLSALEALTELGIEAFAIKGVAEEARLYTRIGERPCSDIDIAIAATDIGRIDEILDRLSPDHQAFEAVVALVRHRQLQHVHTTWHGVALDLHLDPLKVGLWTRQADLYGQTATTVNGPDGREVPVLAPALALVLSLLHLNKDRFSYLGAYGEVARMVSLPDLDWDFVDRFVAGEALEVPVRKSLSAVVDALALDLDVPAVGGWRARLWDALWPPSSRLLGHAGRDSRRLRQGWIPVLTTGRWPEVAREARRKLMPPRDLLDVHRPELSDHGLLRRFIIDRLPAGGD